MKCTTSAKCTTIIGVGNGVRGHPIFRGDGGGRGGGDGCGCVCSGIPGTPPAVSSSPHPPLTARPAFGGVAQRGGVRGPAKLFGRGGVLPRRSPPPPPPSPLEGGPTQSRRRSVPPPRGGAAGGPRLPRGRPFRLGAVGGPVGPGGPHVAPPPPPTGNSPKPAIPSLFVDYAARGAATHGTLPGPRRPAPAHRRRLADVGSGGTTNQSAAVGAVWGGCVRGGVLRGENPTP